MAKQLFPRFRVGMEAGRFPHDGGPPVEVVVRHERVIEVERDGEPVRDNAVGEPDRTQRRHIRGLDADTLPIGESDLIQRPDFPY